LLLFQGKIFTCSAYHSVW